MRPSRYNSRNPENICVHGCGPVQPPRFSSALDTTSVDDVDIFLIDFVFFV